MNRRQRRQSAIKNNKAFINPAGIKNRIYGAQVRINNRFNTTTEAAKQLTNEELEQAIQTKKLNGKHCSSTDMQALFAEKENRRPTDLPHTSIQ
jgi:hypothetical protein